MGIGHIWRPTYSRDVSTVPFMTPLPAQPQADRPSRRSMSSRPPLTGLTQPASPPSVFAALQFFACLPHRVSPVAALLLMSLVDRF